MSAHAVYFKSATLFSDLDSLHELRTIRYLFSDYHRGRLPESNRVQVSNYITW